MSPKLREGFLSLFALFLSLSVLAEQPYSKPELRAELLHMMEADQEARTKGDWEKVKALDRKHSAFLSNLLRESGWPRITEVGPDGARAAWLLAQPADHDPKLQKAVLKAIRSYLPDEEANPQDVALLSDRIAVAEGRPQQYGTQGRCLEGQGWQPNQIENPQQVDLRREEMNLPPLHSYSARMQRFCN